MATATEVTRAIFVELYDGTQYATSEFRPDQGEQATFDFLVAEIKKRRDVANAYVRVRISALD